MKNSRINRVFCLNLMSKLLHGILAALIFLFIFSLLGQKESQEYEIDRHDGTVGYQEPAWVLQQGEYVLDPELKLPAYMELEAGKPYSMSTVITYDGSEDSVPYAFFYSHHIYCQAYLDRELMMSYMPQDIEGIGKARSPGNIYAGFSLPPNCRGKTLEIRFLPLLQGNLELELPNIYFGDYPSSVHSQFVRDIPQNILGVLAAFIGVVAILFATVALSGFQYREGIFIGLFAMVFGIYDLTEAHFNLYLISNPYYTYLLNYMTFALMPVTLMAFLREKYRDRFRRKICMVMTLGGILLLGAQWYLHFEGILDMRQFLPLIHVEYFGCMLVVFLLTVTIRDRKTKKGLILQLLPIIAGICLDAGEYYLHWGLTRTDAGFSSIGVVIFLIFELHHVWRSSIDIYTESIRAKYYQEMALEDKLTGVGNRRAFEEEKQAIIAGERECRTILVGSADVNDLKQTNDTLGHSEGDYLIRSTAQVLSGIAEGCGRVFRTGGDEFILFLYDVTEAELEEKEQKAREQVKAMNSQGRAFLSIALGHEFVEGLDVESAVQKADRNMYLDKGQKKEYIRREYGREYKEEG